MNETVFNIALTHTETNDLTNILYGIRKYNYTTHRPDPVLDMLLAKINDQIREQFWGVKKGELEKVKTETSANRLAYYLANGQTTDALDMMMFDLPGAEGLAIKTTALKLACQNLPALRDVLNDLESAIAEHNQDCGTLRRLDEIIDVTSLPVYGQEPADTTGIYSWDDRTYLVANPFEGRNLWGTEIRRDNE